MAFESTKFAGETSVIMEGFLYINSKMSMNFTTPSASTLVDLSHFVTKQTQGNATRP